MFTTTRRRALALLAAAAFCLRPGFSRAQQGEQKKPPCLERKEFGSWKAGATNTAAGAQTQTLAHSNATACRLLVEVRINTDYAGVIFATGDIEAPDDLPELTHAFLTEPGNRFIVRAENGKVAVDEPLCGVCTNIEDESFTMILPIAMGPLLQENAKLDLVFKLAQDECSFTLDAETLRQALHWSAERRIAFAATAEAGACEPMRDGCFLTTACCEAVGLGDDCFELAALRHYRDRSLAPSPQGRRDIGLYYELAPLLLTRMPRATRRARLISCYARYILPCAIAARLGLSRLAYRLYCRMMIGLVRDFAPEHCHRFQHI